MRNRLVLLAITVIVATALMLACSSPAPTPTSAPAPTTAPKPAATTAAAAPTATAAPKPTAVPPAPTAAKPIEARLTDVFSNTHVFGQGVTNWAKLVEKETGGRLVIKIFPDGSLYKEDQELAAARSGAVELVATRMATMTTVDPSAEVFELPYMWKDYNQIHGFLNTPLIANWYENKWNKELGLKFLAHNHAGGGIYFFSKVRPINKVDDLKGLKMRIWPGKSPELTTKALGINGIVIAITDTFTALQQGMIDGVITTSQAYLDRAFVDVAKYGTSYPSMLPTAGWILANAKWYNSLPPDIQKVLSDTVRPQADAFTVKLAQDADDPAFEKVKKDKGAIITQLSEDEAAKIRQLVRPVFAEVGAQVNPELLNAAYKLTGITK